MESDGNITPNIFPNQSFFTFGFSVFLMAFNPQKVKKMVTFSPVAAAPLAKTKVAKTLSKSSLNRIKVLPFAVETGCETSIAQGVAFSTLTMYVPFSV